MQYNLFSSDARSLSISLEEGNLSFHGEDFGEECVKMNGSRFYEFYYTLNGVEKAFYSF